MAEWLGDQGIVWRPEPVGDCLPIQLWMLKFQTERWRRKIPRLYGAATRFAEGFPNGIVSLLFVRCSLNYEGIPSGYRARDAGGTTAVLQKLREKTRTFSGPLK